ncbi:unnamed protein product [Eretmochelys imbricata]
MEHFTTDYRAIQNNSASLEFEACIDANYPMMHIEKKGHCLCKIQGKKQIHVIQLQVEKNLHYIPWKKKDTVNFTDCWIRGNSYFPRSPSCNCFYFLLSWRRI